MTAQPSPSTPGEPAWTPRVRPVPCQDLDPSHGIAYTRRYLTGLKCNRHTPSAWAGRPESPPGPGWPAGSYLTRNTEPPAEQEPSS